MVSMSALHSLTAELHAGFLTLAFICIVIVAVSQIVVRMKKCLPKRLVDLAIKVRGYAEAAGYVGAMAGVVGLLLSAWTGMYAWPQDALLESAVVRNKITLSLYATLLWCHKSSYSGCLPFLEKLLFPTGLALCLLPV